MPLSPPRGREALTSTAAYNFSTEMRINLKTPPHNGLALKDMKFIQYSSTVVFIQYSSTLVFIQYSSTQTMDGCPLTQASLHNLIQYPIR